MKTRVLNQTWVIGIGDVQSEKRLCAPSLAGLPAAQPALGVLRPAPPLPQVRVAGAAICQRAHLPTQQRRMGRGIPPPYQQLKLEPEARLLEPPHDDANL